MAWAASRKSHGSSSSSPLWLAPKYAVSSSQNFLVSLPAKATVKHWRDSLHSKLALASKSADTRSSLTAYKRLNMVSKVQGRTQGRCMRQRPY